MLSRRKLFPMLIWFVTALPFADGAIVRFHETVDVPLSVVRLGDVADVFDVDPERIEELRSLVLAPTPPAGRQRRYSFSEIRSRCIALGVNLSEIEFQGPSVVIVRSAVEPPPKPVAPVRPPVVPATPNEQPRQAPARLTLTERRDIELRLALLVRETLSIDEEQRREAAVTVTIDNDDAAKLHCVPTSQWQLLKPAGTTLATTQEANSEAFLVRGSAADGTLVVVPIQAAVTLPRRQLVLKHTIPSGHILQESDLAWELTTTPPHDELTPHDVIGSEAVRSMSSGRELTAADVRPLPLVRTGDLVTVYSRRGGISVKRIFKSRGNAAMNEAVALVALEGREQVSAVVIGYHEAEIVAPSVGESEPTAPGDPSTIQLLTGGVEDDRR